MALVGREITNAYIGGDSSSWTLFDESIISQSTTGEQGVIASRRGTIIRPSYSYGYGNGAYSIGTWGDYDVISISPSHGNCHLGMSSTTYNNLISNYSQIRFVCDCFGVGPGWNKSTTSDNKIWFGKTPNTSNTLEEYYIVTKGAMYATTGGGAWANLQFTTDAHYSLEEFINTSDLVTTAIITDLSDDSQQVTRYKKTFWQETNGTYIINGGGPIWIAGIADSRNGPVVYGNIHIYVK